MQLEARRRQVPTVNVSALVDVIFTLLIFLLLAATFNKIGGIEVNLPEAESGAAGTDEGLVVTVTLEGRVEIDGALVNDEALLDALRAMRKDHTTLILVADSSVALKRAVHVLDNARLAGFSSISIAVRDKINRNLDDPPAPMDDQPRGSQGTEEAGSE